MLTRMTEEDWAITLKVFDAARSGRGQPGRNDRKFLEALHYFTVHNVTWRALPAEFGNWNSIWKRFWRLSIAVNRRHRRAKTDRIDGVKLLRTLMAWMRGERQVCTMVQPPSPEDEDRRRLARERARLLKERAQHTNRIKGLLFGQGIRD